MSTLKDNTAATANIWANDGSHKTIFGNYTSTTAAVVGKSYAAFRLTGQYGSSLHAERLGLIAAPVGARNRTGPSVILTDHLNSVRDMTRIKSRHYEEDGWRPQPAHELYKWFLQEAQASSAEIRHVKAHTESDDPNSTLNNQADREAHIAHHSSSAILMLALTGWMRPFAPYIAGIGYAQDNWKSHLNKATLETVYSLQASSIWRKTVDPVRPKPVITPEYFYKHSPAGLTAKYQLLLRSGHFVTDRREYQIDRTKDPTCGFCGHESQDERHLFVHCPYFDSFCNEAISKCARLHAGALAGQPVGQPAERQERMDAFAAYASHTIHGGPADPTDFWIGIVPPVPKSLGDMEAKMAHHLSIMLASRIAGAYQREKSRRWDRGRKRKHGQE